MTDADRIFVDTNVLLSATDARRRTHSDAQNFLWNAKESGWRLFASTQIFREYLVVATRPESGNGLGLSPEHATENLSVFQLVVQILPEDVESMQRLQWIVRNHELKGKRIHDAQIAATMWRHGLQKLKTYNPSDFVPFSELELIPASETI